MPPVAVSALGSVGGVAASTRATMVTVGRCGLVTDAGRRTLVLGGIRSGKSAWAERAAAASSGTSRATAGAGTAAVTYVATAPRRPDDPEWAARVIAHQRRRPATWSTVEPAPDALPAVLADAVPPVK